MEGVEKMIDAMKYVVDGVVEREKIAMDIKYRVISKQDISDLVKNSMIKTAFFGNGYTDKKPQSSWDRDYVDKLSYAVVSEAFNEEYLFYLNEVAEYVSKKEENICSVLITFVKKHPFVSGLVGLAVVGIVVFAVFKMTR